MFKWKRIYFSEEDGGTGSAGGSDTGLTSEDFTSFAADLGFKTEGDGDEAAGDNAETESEQEKQLSQDDPAKTDGIGGTGDKSQNPGADGNQQPAPGTEVLKAPDTWKPDIAAKFNTLPVEVQREILKREGDMRTGLEQYKSMADYGKAVADMINPFREQLAARGHTNPISYIESLARADDAIMKATGQQKVEFFKQLATHYGVTIGDEFGEIDPVIAGLQAEVNRLKGQVESGFGEIQTKASVAEQERLTKEVTSFATDPANIYFDELASDIAFLISASKGTMSLKDAYAKAMWMNESVRLKENGRLQTERDEAAKKAKGEAVAKAKAKAALNVKSNNLSGNRAVTSIDDTLNAAFDEIEKRVH